MLEIDCWKLIAGNVLLEIDCLKQNKKGKKESILKVKEEKKATGMKGKMEEGKKKKKGNKGRGENGKKRKWGERKSGKKIICISDKSKSWAWRAVHESFSVQRGRQMVNSGLVQYSHIEFQGFQCGRVQK